MFCEHMSRLQHMTTTTSAAEIRVFEDQTAELRTYFDWKSWGLGWKHSLGLVHIDFLHVSDKRSEERRADIEVMKKRLEDAKQHRAHVAEYNSLARKILVYPKRDEMIAYVIKSANLKVLHSNFVNALSSSRKKSRNMTMLALLRDKVWITSRLP